MWRSEPGCTEATVRGGSRPRRRQANRLCFGRRRLRVLQPPNLGHHHDDVIGGVLALSVCHSQPDARRLEAKSKP
jgi:hypothetical protein